MSLAIFTVIIFIFSAVVHEYMHGLAADEQGDPTPRMLGCLTLNPIAHLDLWGSFLVPVMLYFASGGQFVFGYAKPVPYNPLALRDKVYGSAKVALAGPAANLLMAVLFAVVFRFFPFGGEMMLGAIAMIIQINLVLAIVNLLPLPGLDGSKILMPFMPVSWQNFYHRLEQRSMIVVFLLIMLLFPFLAVIIDFIFKLLTGYR